jgi:hypothetical protein
MKRELEQLQYIQKAITELELGLIGAKGFIWGETEGRSKMGWLSRLGFVLVSKSKLEKGGHELKKGAKPVGTTYYGAPIKRYTDLYLLNVQTKRALKWYDLWSKGKALCEDGTYGKTPLKMEVKNEEGSG